MYIWVYIVHVQCSYCSLCTFTCSMYIELYVHHIYMLMYMHMYNCTNVYI